MRKPRSEYPSEQADKFLVRFPEGMRDVIAEVARRNGRSMNSEIIARLEESFRHNPDDLPPNLKERFQNLEKMMEGLRGEVRLLREEREK